MHYVFIGRLFTFGPWDPTITLKSLQNYEVLLKKDIQSYQLSHLQTQKRVQISHTKVCKINNEESNYSASEAIIFWADGYPTIFTSIKSKAFFNLMLRTSKFLDLVKFVMCTLVSRDRVPFLKYIKRHVCPGTQGTHDKLNQIQGTIQPIKSMIYSLHFISLTIFLPSYSFAFLLSYMM